MTGTPAKQHQEEHKSDAGHAMMGFLQRSAKLAEENGQHEQAAMLKDEAERYRQAVVEPLKAALTNGTDLVLAGATMFDVSTPYRMSPWYPMPVMDLKERWTLNLALVMLHGAMDSHTQALFGRGAAGATIREEADDGPFERVNTHIAQYMGGLVIFRTRFRYGGAKYRFQFRLPEKY